MTLSNDLFLGFIKLHVLFHAGQEPVYGLWLIEELSRHGYRLSPGTLYPILHGLQRDGLLASENQVVNGKVRRYYRLTEAGRLALQEGQARAIELLEELNPDTDKDKRP
jgi:DNA-binding PadR family transcriptional regulator